MAWVKETKAPDFVFLFFCIWRKHIKWIKCHEILNPSQSRTHHAANGAPTKHLSLSAFPDNGRGSSGHLQGKHQHRESKHIHVSVRGCTHAYVCQQHTHFFSTRILTLSRSGRHFDRTMSVTRSDGQQCAMVPEVTRGGLPTSGWLPRIQGQTN